ncbi:E3 ubiquitin-protein ligase Mdm2 [Orussus abietinus]|uniref:E3 ubiquitin-protein ligase Mdm2 n=1 Tax=Orussus abietinus TaxID=222816 RepID=UPI0006255503|nr:E3 ubiquitin-protein ligase Mdm2 [Orussus abietinus]
MSLALDLQNGNLKRDCWKRKDSEKEDENEFRNKKQKPWFDSDSDDDSFYEKVTEGGASEASTHTWVSSSSESDNVSVHVEYEVASLSESNNPFAEGTSTSDPEDIMSAIDILDKMCESDIGLADDSNDSRSSVDSEIGKADYWTCIQCNARNNNPLFRYCEKCYQIRKNFFPPRPKWKRKRCEASSKPNSQLTLTSMDSGLGFSQESKHSLALDLDVELGNNESDEQRLSLKLKTDTNSTEESNADRLSLEKEEILKECTPPTESHLPVNIVKKETVIDSLTKCDSLELDADKLCHICTLGPKNGALVHGSIAHICCCYRCAIKVWRGTRRCPICNRKVTNVFKAFYI